MTHGIGTYPVSTGAAPAAETLAPLLPQRPRSRRLGWLAGMGGVAVVGLVLVIALKSGVGRHAAASTTQNGHNHDGIPVNTITPTRKTLVRLMEQPGSIRPLADAELHAKTSGYVKFIQRECTPGLAAQWFAEQFSVAALGPASSPALGAALLADAQRKLGSAPQKDIGSRVQAGEVVMHLDVPESAQDVAQKEALYLMAEAELRQCRTSIGTYEAGVTAAQA